MRDHPMVEAVELALRRSGFMITRRSWSGEGDCVIRFRGIAGPFANFHLRHELLMDAKAFDDRADFDAYVDDLTGYIGRHADDWNPAAVGIRNARVHDLTGTLPM